LKNFKIRTGSPMAEFRIPIFILFIFTSICISCTDKQQPRSLNQEAEDIMEKQLLPDPGVVSFTFRHYFEEDVEGTLDIIKEMGINNIEFSSLFGITAADLRDYLDERDMVCTSYGVSYDELVNNLDQVAIDAKTLGAKYVRVAYIPHESPFDIHDANRITEVFNEVGSKLNEQGLTFAYHNHGYELSPHENGTLFDYIIQNTNPDYVSFEMDIFWVVWPGYDPIALLNKYPDRFRLVHLDDLEKGIEGDMTDSGYTRSEKSVPIGQGQVDIHAFLKAAKNSSIEYFYIEDESNDVINRVPKSIEFLKSLK
jgi:sugar phosphate isomerase/epimerase